MAPYDNDRLENHPLVVNLPKFYFNFQVRLLRLLGMDLMVETETWYYRIYSAFSIVYAALFVCFECVELLFHDDFNGFIYVATYTVSHVLGIGKMVMMYVNRKKIGDLLKSLHDGRYEPNEERGGAYERKCIKDGLLQTNILTVSYFGFLLFTFAMGLLGSLETRLTLPPAQWTLPFCPFSLADIHGSPTFEIAYIYTFSGTTMISLYVLTIDITVISIIAQITSQLKILEHCIRNYKDNGVRRHQKEMEQVTTNKAKSNKKSVHEFIHDSLVECIEYHYNILDTVDTVEYLCSYLALSVFMANLILLCLLMYISSLLTFPSLRFFLFFFYYFIIATQVFLYCWTGNQMTLAGEALALGVAETYSPDAPLDHGKALKLMMIRAQRPLCITAGKFVPLSLNVYMTIIRGSFSYFMVLRQVNSE